MSAPFWSGKNATVILFQNGKQIIVNVQSWDCKPNVVKAADGINGEDRDRLQTIINYYELNLSCLLSDNSPVQAMIDNQANDDANVLPFDRQIGFKIQINDGSKVAYAATEVFVDDWQLASSGRTDRNKFTLPLRARYFQAVQAA